MCITHRPRQQPGDGRREGELGIGWRKAKSGGNRDIFNSVNNKNKGGKH